MTDQPKRVFCKDCKHRLIYMPGKLSAQHNAADGLQCMAAPVVVTHPVYGNEEHYISCETRNAAFDCELFEEGRQPWPREWMITEEAKQSEPTEPEPTKEPWWRFWS